MRVYEFAKAHGLSSKDVMVLLKDQGIEVSSHMAVLTQDALLFLEKKYKGKAQMTESQQHKPEPVKEVIATPEVKKSVVAPIAQPEPVVVKPSGSEIPKKVVSPSKTLSVVHKPYLLSELALILNKGTSDLILTLLKWGILSNKNQLLTEELVAKLAHHYEVPLVKPEAPPKAEASRAAASSHAGAGHLKTRLPVVVIMGHVDHGKTTLLDFIRKTRVAAKEKGGITQHLGAYEAITPHGNIVFIDTPGHEAFSKIRVRGTKVADIVVLVVAADDGVMPQTVEALRHAQSMEVPIIVAINKVDKVDKTRIDIVKRELGAQYNLLPEEWGGQTMYLPISAKTGQGIDKLLEMIILQSQLMELQAAATGNAYGFVLESKMEKGRGNVATILTQQGILRVGDYFVAGKVTGKVTSLLNSFSQRITHIGPSHPVLVAGFDELPEAGDGFEVVNKDAYFKAKQVFAGSSKQLSAQRAASVENSVNLIVKTDTNSSKEALLESIAKLSKKSDKGFNVIFSGIGNVSEGDVMLAATTNARILTLHVKAESNAVAMATRSAVSIVSFDIIYKLLEYLQELTLSLAPVKMVRSKTGEAIVRKVFDIKNLGVIAGCYLKQGVFTRDGMVVVWRGTKKIAEGKIVSLQRDKHAVKEVHAGFECAFMVDNFKEWQIDDRVECFVERPEVKK